MCFDRLADVEAAHDGHVHVDQSDVTRATRGGGGLKRHQRRGPIGNTQRAHSPTPELTLQVASNGPVVVHDQGAAPREEAWLLQKRLPAHITSCELRREPESAAFARCAEKPDFSAHDLDQSLADREPEAGAAKPPGGGRFRLRERFEQAFLGRGREADPRIHHFESEGQSTIGFAREAQPDHYLALIGEFDCVANQVEQHLP